MTKSELRSFHAVAKYGGFTAASKKLNISQPTLSTQVKSLEERYGIELFYRAGREFHVTSTGRELYEITSRLHRAETDADILLNSIRGFLAGSLNIAAVGPFLTTDMIVEFKAKYPSIDVGVYFGNSQQCFERLISYEADVGILAGVPADDRVTVQLYSTHKIVVFVNSDHPFFTRDSICLKDLEGESVVRREAGSTTRVAIEGELHAKGITVSPVLELGSREAIWIAVKKGLGLGFVADYAFVSHPNLRAVSICDSQVETKYFLAHLHERRKSKMIKSFCEIALQVASDV